MRAIKKILIAVDLNEISPDVIEYGMTLGLMSEAAIKCIHVRKADSAMALQFGEESKKMLGSPYRKVRYVEELRLQDQDTLQRLVSVINEKIDFDGLNVSVEVLSGEIAETLISESIKWDADIIITGMVTDPHCEKYSPIIKELLDRADTKVVIVPSSYVNRSLKKIGVFINFQFEELTTVLDTIKFAKEHQLEVMFIYLLKNEHVVLEVKKKLKIYHQLFEQDLKSGLISFKLSYSQIVEVITESTIEDDVDLFVLRSKEIHWSLLISKEQYQALRYIKVPILVWKD